MQVTDEIAGQIHDEIGQRHGWSRLWADVGPAQRKDWIEGIAAVLTAEVKGNPHTCHPSHHLRDSDASSYDVVCTKCGETDVAGNGWGKLVEPCAAITPQPTSQQHVGGSLPISDVPRDGRQIEVIDAAGRHSTLFANAEAHSHFQLAYTKWRDVTPSPQTHVVGPTNRLREGRHQTVTAKHFRKKPVVIEAVQWNGTNVLEVYTFMHGAPTLDSAISQDKWFDFENIHSGKDWHITTLEDGPNGEAKHVASVGDWIIKGIQGEFYPCKPHIFAATYEPEENPSAQPHLVGDHEEKALQAVIDEIQMQHGSANSIRQQARNIIKAYRAALDTEGK